MKKSIILLIVLMAAFACAPVAHAERPGVMTATWEYPNPDADVAGFRIYDQTGAMVADIADPLAREYVGQVQITTGKDVSYTMTAYDVDGNESEHTPEFMCKTYPAVPGNPSGKNK